MWSALGGICQVTSATSACTGYTDIPSKPTPRPCSGAMPGPLPPGQGGAPRDPHPHDPHDPPTCPWGAQGPTCDFRRKPLPADLPDCVGFGRSPPQNRQYLCAYESDLGWESGDRLRRARGVRPWCQVQGWVQGWAVAAAESGGFVVWWQWRLAGVVWEGGWGMDPHAMGTPQADFGACLFGGSLFWRGVGMCKVRALCPWGRKGAPPLSFPRPHPLPGTPSPVFF